MPSDKQIARRLLIFLSLLSISHLLSSALTAD